MMRSEYVLSVSVNPYYLFEVGKYFPHNRRWCASISLSRQLPTTWTHPNSSVPLLQTMCSSQLWRLVLPTMQRWSLCGVWVWTTGCPVRSSLRRRRLRCHGYHLLGKYLHLLQDKKNLLWIQWTVLRRFCALNKRDAEWKSGHTNKQRWFIIFLTFSSGIYFVYVFNLNVYLCYTSYFIKIRSI